MLTTQCLPPNQSRPSLLRNSAARKRIGGSVPTPDISNCVRFRWGGWALSKEDAKRRAKNAILKLDPNFQKEPTTP